MKRYINYLSYFFFQAEDGIRDGHVTGVQTCALPISRQGWLRVDRIARVDLILFAGPAARGEMLPVFLAGIHRQHHTARFEHRVLVRDHRSEERRVGKECRSGRSRDDSKEYEWLGTDVESTCTIS